MPDRRSTLTTIGLTALLIAAVAVSFWQPLDGYARELTDTQLKRGLTAYAAARGLNAAISVAQETEVAVQPIGVGVTIGVGQALDPLNDLIERFSTLLLVASAALGIQLLLIDLGATLFVSVLLCAAIVFYLAARFVPALGAMRIWMFRGLLAALLLRFLMVTVALLNGWVSENFFAERQAASIEVLEGTEAALEDAASPVTPDDESFLDRLRGYSPTADIEQSLAALKAKAEAAVEEVVRLISMFVLQTMFFPLLFAWLTVQTIRRITF